MTRDLEVRGGDGASVEFEYFAICGHCDEEMEPAALADHLRERHPEILNAESGSDA